MQEPIYGANPTYLKPDMTALAGTEDAMRCVGFPIQPGEREIGRDVDCEKEGDILMIVKNRPDTLADSETLKLGFVNTALYRTYSCLASEFEQVEVTVTYENGTTSQPYIYDLTTQSFVGDALVIRHEPTQNTNMTFNFKIAHIGYIWGFSGDEDLPECYYSLGREMLD